MKVFRLKTPLRLKEMQKALDRLEGIALRIGAARSMDEISLSKHLADRSFGRKCNIAKQFRYEFLLWLTGKRDIKSAMEASAPIEGSEFILIVFGKVEVGRPIEGEYLPIALEGEGEPVRLERISLSRIKG